MPSADLVVSTPVQHTARVTQLSGLFDLPPTERSELRWSVNLPLEEREWNVGLITGPSGCGKTTIARHLWPEQIATRYEWPADKSVVDGFPKAMPIKELVELLSSVGFSSPPSWLRPFSVLSNGEQFRATMARVLAEQAGLAVVDEFTSVVDRQVAQVGSCAIAKTVRRRQQKFIAVTCHGDLVDWLQPDWVYEPAHARFTWRLLQRRPALELEVCRVHHSTWKLFAHHHYLDQDISHAAHCYVGLYKGDPILFEAVLPMMAPGLNGRNAWRASRLVCLPDYQGVSAGLKFGDIVASAYKALGYRFYATIGHPAVIHATARKSEWAIVRNAKIGRGDASKGHFKGAGKSTKHATTRITVGFEYVGPPMDRESAAGLVQMDAAHLCSRGECRGEAVAGGLCATHYQQRRRAAHA